MAEPEPLENGLLDDEPRHFGDIGNTKITALNDESPPVKQNGISSGQTDIDLAYNTNKSASPNSNSRQESTGSAREESVESGTNELTDPTSNDASKYQISEEKLNFSALKDEHSIGASSDKSNFKSEASDESRDSVCSKGSGKNEASDVRSVSAENINSDSLQSSDREDRSPVVVKSEDSSIMEVEGEDDIVDADNEDSESPASEIVELSSNVSAPNSDEMEVDDESTSNLANAGNNSLNPSIISEDSSKDSIDSSISSNSENSNILNEGESREKSEHTTVNSRADSLENLNKIAGQNDLKTMKNDESAIDDSADESEKGDTDQKVGQATASDMTTGISDIPISTVISSSPAPSTSLMSSVAATLSVNSSTAVVSTGSMPKQTSPGPSQQGYIAKIGSQHVFVPLSNASGFKGLLYPAVAEPVNASGSTTGTPVQPKPEDLMPKSSLETMELMKWELQNRIPDNYNWSVAFHPKKEELSTITSFLLDLGHDVVKEAVYKDIIEIQTKKRENGTLKETEVDSLGKMKMVYENTRKRVEHLNLPMKKCNRCKFKTESEVIMYFHKDHPHYEPAWDHPSAQYCCSLCHFKTKQAPEFSFHMDSVHSRQAKLADKPSWFPCEMCPLDPNTKAKLTKHRVKCLKSFKLNINLQPYYHDVNFCMKTCYYKPRKVMSKPVPPKRVLPQPVRPTLNTRSNPSLMPAAQVRPPMLQPPFVSRANMAVRSPIMYAPQVHNRAIRSTALPVRPNLQINRPPVVREMLNRTIPRHNIPPGLQARLAMPQTTPAQPQVRPPVKPAGKEMSGFEVCELCGGYVKDRQALRIHFYYAHKVEMPQAIFNRPTPPLCCEVCHSRFWTTQGLSKHKATLRHYQSVSNPGKQATSAAAGNDQQCFMCNRRVANLFVHVEQIHGMTMKDLVAMKKCIMCGITAADRRQLEIHMASAHGVLIKANDFLAPEKSPAAPSKPVTPAASPSSTPPTKGGKALVRNNLCVFCQVQFADNTQLTLHCIKNHATCRACGMVVASNKHLANHHCKKMMRDCVICGLRKLSPDSYAVHVKKHVKPCKVKIMRLTEEDIQSAREKIKREYKPQIISLDSDDDSDVEVVDDDKTDAKKETMDNITDKNISVAENSDTNNLPKEKEENEDLNRKDEVESNCIPDTDTKKETDSLVKEFAEDHAISEIKVKEENADLDRKDEVVSKCIPDTDMKETDSLAEFAEEHAIGEIKTENENISSENTDCESKSAADNEINVKKEPAVEMRNTLQMEKDDETMSDGTGYSEMKMEAEESEKGSETCRKRKKSESDFEEDALLGDDTESKRLKFDENSSQGADTDLNHLEDGTGTDMPTPNSNIYTEIKQESNISNDGLDHGTGTDIPTPNSNIYTEIKQESNISNDGLDHGTGTDIPTPNSNIYTEIKQESNISNDGLEHGTKRPSDYEMSDVAEKRIKTDEADFSDFQ